MPCKLCFQKDCLVFMRATSVYLPLSLSLWNKRKENLTPFHTLIRVTANRLRVVVSTLLWRIYMYAVRRLMVNKLNSFRLENALKFRLNDTVVRGNDFAFSSNVYKIEPKKATMHWSKCVNIVDHWLLRFF